MLVSELEKKAETKIRMARAAKSRASDASFKSGLRLYDCGVEMVEEKIVRHKSDLISGVRQRGSYCVIGNRSSSTSLEPKKPSTIRPNAMRLIVIAD